MTNNSTTNTASLKKEKVADYLTQMKELPDELQEGSKKDSLKLSKVKTTEVKKFEDKKEVKKDKSVVREKLDDKLIIPQKSTPEEDSNESDNSSGDNSNRVSIPFFTKEIILAIVDILTVGIMIFLLLKLPEEAQEVRRLKNENIQTKENISLQVADINVNKERADSLKGAFLNDSGVVDFVKEVESLKTGGTVTKLSFPSPKAVKDKTGNFGIPVAITLRGTLSQMEIDLKKLEDLPFLFRAVTIEVQPVLEEAEKLELKYGGFLYVEDKLGEIR